MNSINTGLHRQADDRPREHYSIFDHLTEGVQIIASNWKYVYVNNTILIDCGLVREEVIGRTPFEIFPGSEKTSFFAMLQECMNNGVAKNFEYENPFFVANKKRMHLKIQPAKEGLLIISSDMSEKLKAEELQRQYINVLERLLFITSHKVRQPTTQIMGLAELMDGKINKAEREKVALFFKIAASSLNEVTQELTLYIHEIKSGQLKQKNP